MFVQQVTSPTITVNDYGGRGVEHARVLRVTVVGDDDGLQADLGRIKMLGQQLAARNVLVGKVPVALGSSHEHDLFVFGERSANHA